VGGRSPGGEERICEWRRKWAVANGGSGSLGGSMLVDWI
jgi:hypothetical protein